VFHNDFTYKWGEEVKAFDGYTLTKVTAPPVAPVDEDSDHSMLEEALKQHQVNTYIYEMAEPLHYHDNEYTYTNEMIYDTRSPSNYVSEITRSKVAIYHWAGWYDMWPRDALVWFNNLDNPQNITIGPWYHTGIGNVDLATEHLRWYDYWLKGIDNRIIDEAPIHYFTMITPPTMITPAEGKWQSAWQWPLPDEQPTAYYFHDGPSESIESVNDGALTITRSTSTNSQDNYVADYTTTRRCCMNGGIC
jgi:putative CocE/NonD family hydrolase